MCDSVFADDQLESGAALVANLNETRRLSD